MKIIKEVFAKENRKQAIQMVVIPLAWFVIFYTTIYSIAWLDYNIFY